MFDQFFLPKWVPYFKQGSPRDKWMRVCKSVVQSTYTCIGPDLQELIIFLFRIHLQLPASTTEYFYGAHIQLYLVWSKSLGNSPKPYPERSRGGAWSPCSRPNPFFSQNFVTYKSIICQEDLWIRMGGTCLLNQWMFFNLAEMLWEGCFSWHPRFLLLGKFFSNTNRTMAKSWE